jgi:YD repeat-containing protein
MSESIGGLDEGVLLSSRSAFARRCTITGAVLVVLGLVGIARWWALSLGLVVLMMAALVALIAVEEVADEEGEPLASLPMPVAGGAPVLRTVQFRLPTAVGAQSAVLVGDFNGWSTTHTPMRRGPEGFVVEVHLRPGRTYRYRYLLDGRRWENDWAADRYEPNEFGSDDSVIDVPDHEDEPLAGRAGADGQR